MGILFCCIAFLSTSADPASPPDPNTLIENLRGPKVEVQVEAASALGGLPKVEKDVVAALAAALKDPEVKVRISAVNALQNLAQRARFNGQAPPNKNRPTLLDPFLPDLKKSLTDSNSGVRVGTRRLLQSIEQDCKKIMIDLLDSQDERERIVIASDFLDFEYMQTPERTRAAEIAQAALKHPDLEPGTLELHDDDATRKRFHRPGLLSQLWKGNIEKRKGVSLID